LVLVPLVTFCSVQGEDLKRTHVVQSHRGLVERVIQRIKLFKVLEGTSVDSIAMFEKLLDVACALVNLKELCRLNCLDSIPAVARHAPDAHIITNDLGVPQAISRTQPGDSPHLAQHVLAFREALTAIVPELQRVLRGEGNYSCFTVRVRARGKSLFEGANVLHVQPQDEGDGLWTIRFVVGASMKAISYVCYVQIKKDLAVRQQVCECKNG
jgi:hypothetical protein